ncbi:hypothetical protein B0H19DRAFT_1276258 [Mycena capillaripes]|nr:hypothetical protein B0H19DRAFT_1276258 [Mycena capillaripes]
MLATLLVMYRDAWHRCRDWGLWIPGSSAVRGVRDRVLRASPAVGAGWDIRAAQKIEVIYTCPTIVPVDLRRAYTTVVMRYSHRRGPDDAELEAQ